MTRWACVLLPVLVGLLILPGCHKEYPENLEYEFHPYPSLDPVTNEQKFLKVSASVEKELQDVLRPHFGTPRNPKVELTTPSEAFAQLLANPEMQLSPEQLAKGSSLYRRNCLHCHGLVGDGNGPTGQFLNPKPRDFRQGWFKFRSTAKPKSGGGYSFESLIGPSRADLRRTVRAGIPSASMPAFNLLSDEDIDALVSYVIHLSLRGQVEEEIAKSINLDAGFDTEALVKEKAEKWLREAQLHYLPPPPSKSWQAVHEEGMKTNWARGRDVYLSLRLGDCASCHGTDGRASFLDPKTGEINKTRKNDWGDLNPPRDLTQGVYRGGSRPLDLFYRIRLGIRGSGMRPVSDSVSDEDIWYLVDYVMNLPHQRP